MQLPERDWPVIGFYLFTLAVYTYHHFSHKGLKTVMVKGRLTGRAKYPIRGWVARILIKIVLVWFSIFLCLELFFPEFMELQSTNNAMVILLFLLILACFVLGPAYLVLRELRKKYPFLRTKFQ
jgi:hypothetical protein